MTMTDPIAAGVAYLKGIAAVTTEVPAARIFGTELPAEQADDMPRKAIVLVPAGGGGGPGDNSYLRLDLQRIDAHSYGGTPFQARIVARQVHEAFKLLQRRVVTYTDYDGSTAKVLLHSAAVGGGFVALRDPDTKWPSVLRSYVLLYAEEAVA